MKQMTFADAEYAGKRKQTRKELFLIEMDQVVPWKGLVALIEPHYPKGEGGRPAYNSIVAEIYSRLEKLGAVPMKSFANLHYERYLGTHYLVGMLSMGEGPRAVVGSDFKLKGTENVSVAGSALFPRCGSRNPTVTVVATSLMLAEKLNAERGESLISRAG